MYISCILAKELAENSQVQDAFVIAVEQQAKERLERLSALRRIKPVDMTKLSQQVNTKVGGEAYLLTVKFPYSQVPHLLQFQIRLQYLLPNIDSGYNISYHFLFYKAERNHNGSKPWARILLGSRAELG